MRERSKFRICVLGNFSGRNAGDNAILGCLMHDVSAQYPDVEFVIPTFNPNYVRQHFSRYAIQPVSLLPWALSLKILGLPVFRAVLGSDMVLVTDNILFDMKLFNPLFNYLFTLSFVLPLAKQRGIPVILYNMSLGPIKTKIGKRLFRRVIESCRLIILRDEQSQALLDRLQIPYPRVEKSADCAVNVKVTTPELVKAIVEEAGILRNPKGTIGFNINTYLDAYLTGGKASENLDRFAQMIAETVDRLVEETGMDVLFFVTQVMDANITRAAMNKVRHADHVQMISTRDYTYEELASVMARVEVMVGMRTHALILASAVGTPVVGIISYPKTLGYLTTIQQEQWTISFADLNAESLASLIERAYQERESIRESLKPIMQREKAKASHSAVLLKPFVQGQPVVSEVHAS